MILNYKYRIEPTKLQKAAIEDQFFASNQAYNHALNIRINELETKTRFSKLDGQIKEHLRNRNLNYHSGVIQESVKNMEKTLKQFFKSRSDAKDGKSGSTAIGFPKYKRSDNIEQSFYFKNQRISWTEKHFKILKMKIKWRYHREIPNRSRSAELGNIVKSVVIKRESDGKYYVIMAIEHDFTKELEKTGERCGIDLNIKNIAISTNRKEDMMKAIKKLKKYDKKYLKIQKELTTRYELKSRSKTTKKLQKKQNKIHKKVKNVKENFFHEVSAMLMKRFDQITVEDLAIKKMKESEIRSLNRLISEVSWGSLLSKLEYKSLIYNKSLIKIDPAYTSQRCSECGFKHKKNRKTQASFKCLRCGFKLNADINAARNILNYNDWSLEQKAWKAASSTFS
jgi:putative transposase